MKKSLTIFVLFWTSTILLFADISKERVASSVLSLIEEDGEVSETYNTVFVIFKTHLDVGFTDLSTKVEAQYMSNDIPAALQTIEEIRNKSNGNDRYIWTIGTWILSQYLANTSSDNRVKLEKAIENGDIVWHALPYTIESETTSLEIFEGMLKNAKKLDKYYGKKTLAANMSDVPGHTRSIVSPLAKAGIRLLHIGMNKSVNISQIPVLQTYPDICRWQHPDGYSILLLQKKAYGHDILLPGGNILSMQVKGDNRGPHTTEQVEKIYADLRVKYPEKNVIASNLNDVAKLLVKYEKLFPVLTGEIGDTWIHGMGSAPIRMAKARALYRLYKHWIQNKQLDPDCDESISFALRLGLIAEHTWGADCAKYLKNETPDKYNVDGFQASRNLPEFLFMETSWREIDDYIPQAIALLPVSLQQEAYDAVAEISVIPEHRVGKNASSKEVAPDGSLNFDFNGIRMSGGLFTLQTFNFTDFRKWTLSMMSATGAKGGMEGSQAVSASVHPEVKSVHVTEWNGQRKINCELTITSDTIDNRICPEKLVTEYTVNPNTQSVEMTFTMVNKPANRMAEALWMSFVPENITDIVMEKLGSRVNVNEVIEGGNARMMAIDHYVDMITSNGTIRITSYDTPLILIGDRANMSYKISPDIHKGVHFCLFNNLWGTNFSMWFEGSITYRFKVELL